MKNGRDNNCIFLFFSFFSPPNAKRARSCFVLFIIISTVFFFLRNSLWNFLYIFTLKKKNEEKEKKSRNKLSEAQFINAEPRNEFVMDTAAAVTLSPSASSWIRLLC